MVCLCFPYIQITFNSLLPSQVVILVTAVLRQEGQLQNLAQCRLTDSYLR